MPLFWNLVCDQLCIFQVLSIMFLSHIVLNFPNDLFKVCCGHNGGLSRIAHLQLCRRCYPDWGHQEVCFPARQWIQHIESQFIASTCEIVSNMWFVRNIIFSGTWTLAVPTSPLRALSCCPIWRRLWRMPISLAHLPSRQKTSSLPSPPSSWLCPRTR